tara:strand:- start:1843 stop:2274 length:432 start_codon:yes stop_codon:yes gene_type:complete
MKRKSIYTIAALLTIAFTIGACSKEERSPKLIVHVQEKDGTSASGASVRAWPGQNAGQPGSIINEARVDQSGNTDAAGDVTFEFDASVVLDLDVTFYKNILDTTSLGLDSTWVDTLTGHKVVKLEAIRQKSEENTTNEMVEVK